MTELVLDFETACLLDLKKVGAWRYTEHWSFEVLCLVFGADVWDTTSNYCTFEKLRKFASDPAPIFVSHGQFEQAVWANYMVPEHGLPPLPPERWHDIMAVAAYKAVPLKHERLLTALALGMEKDKVGSRLAIAASKPDKKTGVMDRSPATMQRIIEYCRTDVAQETATHARLGDLPPNERQVWLLDQKINQRGIGVDLDFVRAAKLVVDRATVPLLAEFRELTGGINPGQVEKLRQWCSEHGIELPDMTKETIDAVLLSKDDSECLPLPRSVLGIRRLLAGASVKKLDAFLACTCRDGRARGLLQYHAAGTGRWGGRLIQPQNLAWDKAREVGCSAADLVEAIRSGNPDLVERVAGCDATTGIGLSLRSAFIPAVGKRFAIGDFSGIEARVVLALAGQHDKCAMMAAGHDVYLDMAADIYCQPKGSLDKTRDAGKRHIGKNTVLGCGFQMGVDKFHERYCPDQSIEFAQSVIDAYRKTWAPRVPKLWYALDAAGVECMRTGHAEAYGCVFNLTDGWLTIDLPSGWQRLWYYDPQPAYDQKFGRVAWTCWAMREGQWKKRKMYGGLLAENVVQALARGLMVAAMMRLEAAGLPIVLTVHDEIICEVPEDASLDKFRCLMAQPTAWAERLGVPIAVETPKELLHRYAK